MCVISWTDPLLSYVLPSLVSFLRFCGGGGEERNNGREKREKKMKAEETKNAYREVNIEQIA